MPVLLARLLAGLTVVLEDCVPAEDDAARPATAIALPGTVRLDMVALAVLGEAMSANGVVGDRKEISSVPTTFLASAAVWPKSLGVWREA